MINDLTLLTVNFNNTYYTLRTIESFFTQCSEKIPVCIIDNSNAIPIHSATKKYFTVIDNTNYKLTGNYNQISKNHCATIDYALKNVIKTKYVLLCDNDILFKYSINTLLNEYQQYDAIGGVGKDFCIPDRLYPYCCFINVEKFNQEGLSYFDDTRCSIQLNNPVKNITNIDGTVYTNTTANLIYDTGASFYDDIRFLWNLKIVNINDYILHYKSGSHNDRAANKSLFNANYKYDTYIDFLKNNLDLLSIKII